MLRFRGHALRRMFERGITVADVERVLATGETIREYGGDRPYPNRLVLGWSRDRPIHVLAADDPESSLTVVITACQPDPARWEPDFGRRRP
ncbi:MAG: DUF4258 domain-containing protein [Gemmatimonadales bacterium]